MAVSETFLKSINLHIEKIQCQKIYNRIFIFDYQAQDFISLRNESLSKNMDHNALENETVRVITHNLPPYIEVLNDTNTITGFVGDIWNVFAEFLKFKTELIQTDFSYGTSMLLDNSADVMLTAGIAHGGFRDLEYSQPYFYNWYQLYMRLPSRTPNSTFYIRTLTPTFWYACIAVFMVLTVALRFTIRVLNRVGRRYYSRYLEPPISMPTCFLSVISGFVNQGFDVHVQSYSARAQVIIALVFGYTVYSGMSAVLVSELAVSELQMPIKSLDDVVNKGKWSLCIRHDSFVHEILMDDRRYQKILNGKGCKRYATDDVIPKNMLCNSDVIILESQAIMTNILLNEKLKCDILTIKGKYYRRGNSIVVYKNFKFRKLIYLYLEKLRGNGILQKLQNQWVRPMKIEDINPPATIEVTLYHVKGILVLYASTVLGSFVVLIAECIISKCREPKYSGYID